MFFFYGGIKFKNEQFEIQCLKIPMKNDLAVLIIETTLNFNKIAQSRYYFLKSFERIENIDYV